jgi:hypothetical protein
MKFGLIAGVLMVLMTMVFHVVEGTLNEWPCQGCFFTAGTVLILVVVSSLALSFFSRRAARKKAKKEECNGDCKRCG